MTQQRIETLIIGAGQAGLATGYHLNRKGREFLVVDGNDRIGDNWRRHYDSLKLYTPAQYCGLPGLAFPADKHTFPGKDEVADYLETTPCGSACRYGCGPASTGWRRLRAAASSPTSGRTPSTATTS